MRNKVISLKEKMDKVYREDPWYGDSFKSVLKKIDSKTAFIRVGRNTHTIAELVAHIIGWREFVLARLRGDRKFRMIQNISFNWRRIDENEETAWKNLLDALDRNQKDVITTLNKSDDDILSMPVYRKKYNMEFLIEGQIQHDLYHLGQISLLSKMLKGNNR